MEPTNPKKPRGRPFPPGRCPNPVGRPRGARNRTTLAAEQLLDGEAEELTRKAIELAKEGNLVALRLCMDRFLPVRHDRPVPIDLPPLNSVSDAPGLISALIAGVSARQVSSIEAMEVAKLVELYVTIQQGLEKKDQTKRPYIVYSPNGADAGL